MLSPGPDAPAPARTEQERARLARELHDGLGGSLAALVLESERAVRAVGAGPGRAEVARLQIIAREALEDLRRSTHIMRREFDLRAALGARLQHTRHRLGGAEVELVVLGRAKTMPSELQLSIFRAAQELLTNVERHAGARRVRLALAYAGDVVRLGVRDDGVGWPGGSPDRAPTARAPRARSGNGLDNLRARAARFGGRVVLRSPPGGGACVMMSFRIPSEGSHLHRRSCIEGSIAVEPLR